MGVDLLSDAFLGVFVLTFAGVVSVVFFVSECDQVCRSFQATRDHSTWYGMVVHIPHVNANPDIDTPPYLVSLC